ncbi:hypothetical protein SDC9_186605 [bioreactor metagenome]|uniref:Uncharacterized protein n=1 Tax=bioreactor metagenome TaxID=1076179 RepID=A0A645HLG5_9ZZZZ
MRLVLPGNAPERGILVFRVSSGDSPEHFRYLYSLCIDGKKTLSLCAVAPIQETNVTTSHKECKYYGFVVSPPLALRGKKIELVGSVGIFYECRILPENTQLLSSK